ncbi:MBL fold metallo-hydrolase [Helcobacillus massiliensis]|uniref:MBL fold metallo-hydrolase n=1 Tax=Helcobacillus massiliensis TaxID=521392 RepID=UPI0021A7E029|nr:MBL fold metallo-hydrolase [Helcobacillus massiliensis]MCT1557416.1 MBL fold metallo-hydrolase [Helcobacillus massiliensis]MCT2036403.1 MBL fold metallo-hydrolase [Helcobacillus massiliensis]MCT2331855.1 MBL fold metallo-hydrolase [Helcobacillus massiliensis]
MKLTVLGCSGSFPSADSPASSYLVQHVDDDGRTWRILLDAGNGSFSTLQRVIDPCDLDAVVISHLHADHFLDVAALEVFRAYHPERDLPVIPVYAPEDAAARLNAATGNTCTTPPGASGPALKHEVLADQRTFEVGPVRFTAREVRHPGPAFGFRIEAGGRTLTYSGDTDSCDSLVDLARDADLFLCEAGYIEGRDDHIEGLHLSGRRAGVAAQEAGAQHLLLTHIPAWTDPQIPMREASEVFEGPISRAELLATVSV